MFKDKTLNDIILLSFVRKYFKMSEQGECCPGQNVRTAFWPSRITVMLVLMHYIFFYILHTQKTGGGGGGV